MKRLCLLFLFLFAKQGSTAMEILEVQAPSMPDQWVIGGTGSSKTQAVDNTGGDGDYIYTATLNDAQRFSVKNHVTVKETDTVDSVRILDRCQRSASGTNTDSVSLLINTSFKGGTIVLTNTITDYYRCMTTSAPGRVGEWTMVQLDSIEIEVKNIAEASARQHRVMRFRVEVFYTAHQTTIPDVIHSRAGCGRIQSISGGSRIQRR